jgi:hypothetical protein
MAAAVQIPRPRTMPTKLLLGWLPKEAAMHFLLNECVFDEPMDAQIAEQKWNHYHEVVEALPQRNCQAPEQLPLTREEQALADRFMQAHRQNPNVRGVVKINPLNLITHQPHVNLHQSTTYTHDATSAAAYARHSLAVAQSNHAMAIRAGLNIMDVDVPHGEFAFTFNQGISQFQVLELARHVSVTTFQDRMLLWAGYHRSYAFITKANPDGMERSLLVALTTDADFLVSPQSPNQGLRAVVCGLRPPLFRDFLDGSLFMEVNLKRKRWVLQVRAACVGVDDLS